MQACRTFAFRKRVSLAACRRPRRRHRPRNWRGGAGCPGSRAGRQPRRRCGGPGGRGSGGAAGEAGRWCWQRGESGAVGWALLAGGVHSMRAGLARPLRAADMKKDVRILLVGERESARAGWLRPPLSVPCLGPDPPRPSQHGCPLPAAGPPSSLALPFGLPAGGPYPLTKPGPSPDLPFLSPSAPRKPRLLYPLTPDLIPRKVLSSPSSASFPPGPRRLQAASFHPLFCGDPLVSHCLADAGTAD